MTAGKFREMTRQEKIDHMAKARRLTAVPWTIRRGDRFVDGFQVSLRGKLWQAGRLKRRIYATADQAIAAAAVLLKRFRMEASR